MIRRKNHRRRAAAVVEMAVVAPLVIIAMLGTVELGYSMMLRQTVTLASHRGARAASLPGAEMSDVLDAVDAVMSAAHVTGYTVDTNLNTMEADEPMVSVTVSLPFDRTGFTGRLLPGPSSFRIGSTSTVQREGVYEDPN